MTVAPTSIHHSQIDAILTSPALAGMRAVDRWLVYLLVPSKGRPGKTDKIPLHYATGNPASVTDPRSWTDVATAAAAAKRWNCGVGFAFTHDCGFWFVDLDSCLEGNVWSPLAVQLAQVLAGAAVEVSSSGKGLHFIGRGTVPPHSNKNIEHHAEIYTADRFCALSGLSLAGDCNTDHTAAIAWVAQTYFPPRAAATADVPDTGPCEGWRGPTDDDELLRRAMRSRSAAGAFGTRATFAELWTADAGALARAYPPDASSTEPFDRSSADAALAQHLAFWTGRHVARIERLMRRSALVRAKWDDRSDYLVERTIRGACGRCSSVLQDREPDTARVTAPSPSGEPLTFIAAAEGGRATIENIVRALHSAESSVRIASDGFRGRIVIGDPAHSWRPFEEVDYAKLRVEFGNRGFKPVSAEIMRSAIEVVADGNRIDSARDWAATLEWDGTPRVETFLSVYCGATDRPYVRAVARYLWTALAGRLLDPGCQVDMVPVFVSQQQGLRKSSAIAALVPDPELAAEIHFQRIDERDTSRLMRGKLVAEIAELQGLRGRERESIKAFITRRIERFVEKYEKFETAYPRRLVFIGTTNEARFLHDPTGERRWLPLHVGQVNVEAIEHDRAQLWAEGIVLFNQAGVSYRDAEHLARFEHSGFKEDDEWLPLIEQWLSTPPALVLGVDTRQPRLPPESGPFLLADLAKGALGLDAARLDKKQQWRIGEILRTLGFDNPQTWINGKNRKAWVKVSSPSLALV